MNNSKYGRSIKKASRRIFGFLEGDTGNCQDIFESDPCLFALKLNEHDIDKPTALNTVYNLISELVDIKRQNIEKVKQLEDRLSVIKECLSHLSDTAAHSQPIVTSNGYKLDLKMEKTADFVETTNSSLDLVLKNLDESFEYYLHFLDFREEQQSSQNTKSSYFEVQEKLANRLLELAGSGKNGLGLSFSEGNSDTTATNMMPYNSMIKTYDGCGVSDICKFAKRVIDSDPGSDPALHGLIDIKLLELSQLLPPQF
ncbi:hypothetical protein AYI68_g2703 [Smittium mucronatum]|uniref:Uncharacterized protein n=1 Tax=Smittium mucronatum TaxID=133383 RepID=A0A1R0H1Y9_9FUNG|nr:hypothetical protein AYI68_g2703 [Smittium mucronatum]